MASWGGDNEGPRVLCDWINHSMDCGAQRDRFADKPLGRASLRDLPRTFASLYKSAATTKVPEVS